MTTLMFPKLRAPVVLVHGLFGFSRVQVGGYTVAAYFYGIADTLEAAGNRVLVPFLTPTGGVAQRASNCGRTSCSIRRTNPSICWPTAWADSTRAT